MLGLVFDLLGAVSLLDRRFPDSICQKINEILWKIENSDRKRKGKRKYPNNSETRVILKELNRFFEVKAEVKGIRNGEHQTIKILINKEAQLFAKYLGQEILSWSPPNYIYLLIVSIFNSYLITIYYF